MVNDDCSTHDSRMKFVDTVEGYFKEKENLPLLPNGLGTSIVAINGAADPARVSAVLISFSACAASCVSSRNGMPRGAGLDGCTRPRGRPVFWILLSARRSERKRVTHSEDAGLL